MTDLSRARVPVTVEAAGDTHIGGRSHNEDAILLRPDLNLFLVADGAGGQNAGNVAASLAITTVAHFFERTKKVAETLPTTDALGLPTAARRLSTAVQEANREILAISKHSDRHRGMGSTLVAALFDVRSRRMHVAHVGDSRCYRLRRGMLEQLTHDHSLINDVLELRPNIADDRLHKLPSNVITRALGMMDNLRVAVRTHDVVPGDRFLLCSDGLTDVVGDGQLTEALSIDGACDDLVSLLINMSLENESSDNIAALVMDCALPAGLDNKAYVRPRKTARHSSQSRLEAVTDEDLPEAVPTPAAAGDEAIHPSDAPPNDAGPNDVGVGSEESARISIAEIAHFEPGGDDNGRDSIHLVPPDSATPDDALEALQHVMSGEEDAGRATRSYHPSTAVTAPRVEKDPEEPDAPQTGETRSPPYSESPGRAANALHLPNRRPPPPPRPRRQGPVETHDFEAERDSNPGTYPDRRAAMPPARDPLDTTDYAHDEMRPCHACGSIIASDASQCMYCGAETGFVVSEK